MAQLRKPSRSTCLNLLLVASATSMLVTLIYFTVRMRCLSRASATSFMWIAFFIEILASVSVIFTQLGVILSTAQAEGERLPQYSNRRPKVDVFITHCGEGHQIVLDTAKAACALDWPSEALRIIILDDSGSDTLAQEVEALNEAERLSIVYASRGVQVETYSKAANLNYGLSLVERLPDGKSDFVGVLDVDMIPEPDWLRTVIPHILNNEKAGLACPPQRYYNLPAGDPLGVMTDDLPGECMIYLQDFTNSTFCTGSGFVARRCALDEIGGIPEETLQEDDLTSYKLLAAGWQSVYVKASLQWGLGPDTFAAYLKQSKRWAVGIIHVNTLMWTEWAKKLPLSDRCIFVLWGVVIGSTAFIWTFVLCALPLLVMTGSALIPMGTSWLGRLALLKFLADSFYHACLSALVDFRLPIHSLFGAIWTQPWKLIMIFRSFIIARLLTKPIHFQPTGLPVHGHVERIARAQRSRRMIFNVVFQDGVAWVHLFVLAICLAGVLQWARIYSRTWLVSGFLAASDTVLAGIAWPPILLHWLVMFESSWIPIAYIVNILPPEKSRENLLQQRSGVAAQYPYANVKKEFMRRPQQRRFICKILYCLLVFVYLERRQNFIAEM